MTTVALFGAAGKVGARITRVLRNDAEYRMLYVETGERGLNWLREQGLEPTSPEEGVRQADLAILAVPDVLMGKIAGQVVPQLKSGTLVILLDPAAPHGGELPERKDIAYFGRTAHECGGLWSVRQSSLCDRARPYLPKLPGAGEVEHGH